MNKQHILLVSMLALTGLANAGWQDQLQQGLGSVMSSGGSGGGGSASNSALSALSQTEMVDGLKEALAKGVETAINSLGKTDGFLSNELVKIVLPSSVQKVADVASKMGGKEYVDELVTTMNRAAESAVPEAASIFADSIRDMSIEDAQSILSGGDDAATQYFRKTGGAKLVERFKPMVKKATDSAGVTAAYKQVAGQAGPMASMLGGDATDIDSYVTNKTVDGLFTMIAAEEKSIRANPLGSGSDLLGKVFGAVK